MNDCTVDFASPASFAGFSSVSSQTDREGCQTNLLLFHFQLHDCINMVFLSLFFVVAVFFS